MNDHDPILAKVRKLLALAEDPAATEHEAEACTAKATRLIADYGIDRALLARSDPRADPVHDHVIDVEAPYAADKLDLLATVATGLRCTAVRRSRRGAGPTQISLHLFGHTSDLERTELLWTSLLLQSAHALARTQVPAYEHKAAFRRSWLAGFRMAVGRRLLEAESLAEEQAAPRFAASGTSSALVLADRSMEVAHAMQSAYPALGTARPRSRSGTGTGQGWAAGQRADLGAIRLGGTRTALRAP